MTTLSIQDTLAQHLVEYDAFRRELAGLYERQGATLERKEMAWAMGTTWGYWLAKWHGMRPRAERSAASIGEDEIRIFYELAQLTRPSSSLVIGHSFGLSTFCLALASPESRVVAIDNWGDGDTSFIARPLSEAIIADEGLSHRVYVHAGTSPADTSEALHRGGVDATLDLAFIDGLHNDEAAVADFHGLVPHLSPRSIVLWHNVHRTVNAFTAGTATTNAWFDQRHVLRTHGPLGIHFSSHEHPLLHSYLTNQSLIWPEWERFIHLTTHEDELRRFEAMQRSAAWKIIAKVSRPLRRMLSTRVHNSAPAPRDL